MKSNNLFTHERVAGTALALATGIAGALAVSPVITDMDGGEFAVIAARGGISHPPGYPLYSAMLRGWHELVAGHFALAPEITSPPALALLSVLMSVATALLAWKAVLTIASKKTPELIWRAAFASGLIMMAWPVLRASTAIEPFSANNLMAAGLMYVAARELSARPEQRMRQSVIGYWPVLLTGLLFGLAFCNHHSLAFAAPMALCLWDRARKHPAQFAVTIAAGFLAGCLPMLWFVVQANSEIGPVWGGWPDNFGNQLVRHLFRLGYGTFQLTAGASGSVMGGPEFLIQVIGKSLGALAVIAGAGVDLSCRIGLEVDARGKKFSKLVFASFLGSGIVMPMMFRQNITPDAAEIMARFAALPTIFLIPFLAFGAAPLTNRALRGRLKNNKEAASPFLAAALVGGVAAVIFAAINSSHLPVKMWAGRSRETLANLHLDLAANAAAVVTHESFSIKPALILTNSDLDYFGSIYKNARRMPNQKPAIVIQSGLWPTRWHRKAVLRELTAAGFELPAAWVTSAREFMEIEDSFRLLAAILKRLAGETTVNLAAGNFPEMDRLLAASFPLGPFIRVVGSEDAIPPHDAVLRMNAGLSRRIRTWMDQRRPATAWENHALDGWRRSWTALGLPASPETPPDTP